jgi:hypothetical protein
VTAAEVAAIQRIVRETTTTQGISLVVPPAVCAEVARILRSSTRTPRKGVAADARVA